MSKSGQLDLHCTVELNCSGLSAYLAGASGTHDRALDTYEPSCVPRVARPFFIPVVHNLLGLWGTWQHWSSPLGEARPGPHVNAGAHLSKEVRSGAEEHLVAPELSSRGGRAQNHGTHGSVRAHIGSKAMSGAEERMAAPKLNSARRRGLGPRGSTGAHLSKEVRSGAAGHVAALKPTSTERCCLKLQLTWQRLDARPAPCLDLELVCGGTRSSGCRQKGNGRERRHRAWRSAARGEARGWQWPSAIGRGRWHCCVNRGRAAGCSATRHGATDKRGRASQGPGVSSGCERERGECGSMKMGR
jgi:hypothetical protein